MQYVNFITKKLTEAKEPGWLAEGTPLELADLARLDASEFLDDHEFDFDWRLCRVPIELFSPYMAGGLTDEEERDRFDSIRKWYAGGIDDALSTTPVVAIWNGKSIYLADGWHRVEIARQMQHPYVIAAVGIGYHRF